MDRLSWFDGYRICEPSKCEVLGSHSSAEEECPLECYATSTGTAIDVSEQRAARSSCTDSPLIQRRHASGNRASHPTDLNYRPFIISGKNFRAIKCNRLKISVAHSPSRMKVPRFVLPDTSV